MEAWSLKSLRELENHLPSHQRVELRDWGPLAGCVYLFVCLYLFISVCAFIHVCTGNTCQTCSQPLRITHYFYFSADFRKSQVFWSFFCDFFNFFFKIPIFFYGFVIFFRVFFLFLVSPSCPLSKIYCMYYIMFLFSFFTLHRLCTPTCSIFTICIIFYIP